MPEHKTDMTHVKVEIEERIAILRLSDPARRNAMSLTMREECVVALRALENDGEADAVVITGDGDKAFSAGADLDELARRTIEKRIATARRGRGERTLTCGDERRSTGPRCCLWPTGRAAAGPPARCCANLHT